MGTAGAAAHSRFEITVEDTGDRFACIDGLPVLKAMTALGGRGIPSGCHGGGCGVCKVRVLDGDYRTAAMSRDHVSAEEEAGGIALACRLYPASDLRLKVLGRMQKAAAARRYGLI